MNAQASSATMDIDGESLSENMEIEKNESSRANTVPETKTCCIEYVQLSDIKNGEFLQGEAVKLVSSNSDDDGRKDGHTFHSIQIDLVPEIQIHRLTLWTESPDKSLNYRQKLLKVGSSIVGSKSGCTARIEHLDAEWHRDQTWAVPNEYLGSRVRTAASEAKEGTAQTKTLSNSTEANGTVWGWLPKACNIKSVAAEDAIWLVRLDNDGAPIHMSQNEILEARQRYENWQGGFDQIFCCHDLLDQSSS